MRKTISYSTIGFVALAALMPGHSRAQDAAPGAASRPVVMAAPAAGLEQPWVTFKGDLQRTGAREGSISLPLNLMWRHSTTDAPATYVTSPLVAGPPGQRRVYFAAGTTLYCLDAQTGAQIWRSTVFTKPITAPISMMSGETGDVILAVTSNGRLNAISTTNGGQLWEANAKAPVQSVAPMLVRTGRGDRIFVAVTGRMVAFTREGAVDPTSDIRLGRGSTEPISPTAPAAIDALGERLYINAQDQKLYAIDLQSGKVIYAIQLSAASFASPVVLRDQIIVAAGETITSLRSKTGEVAWRLRPGGRIMASPAARVTPTGTVIYAGTGDGKFAAIDAQSGKALWTVKLGRRLSVSGTPVALTDVILVGTNNGLMFGLNPQDGAILWQYRLKTEREVIVRSRTDEGGYGGEGGGGSGGSGGAGVSPISGSAGQGGYNGDYNGGGYPGESAPGGGPAAQGRKQTIRYGISSIPTVVGNQVFVLANNAALYAFNTTPFDAEPPRAIEPSLALTTSTDSIRAFSMSDDKPLIVPGKGPIYFAVQLEDAGSGIDPASVKAQLDGKEVTGGKRVSFDPARGVLTVTLTEARTAGGHTTLEDGNHSLTVSARDYRNNQLAYTGSFVVDKTLKPPSPPSRRPPFGPPGSEGGSSGGYPGGGYPGGGSSSGGSSSGGYPGGGYPGGGYPGGGYPGGAPVPSIQ